MYLSTLSDWLEQIGNVHSVEIDLGLDRVREVAGRLGVLKAACPVVIVGGTNGKGSTVAGLEAIYQEAGLRVGCFTSPILYKHNEYVRIAGQDASDEAFCEAYSAIEEARGSQSLTPFEFHTLAALWMFQRAELDVMLLEVGLGGRLDAVNIMEPDVAVITSISLDHTEWLGDTLEKIGLEKAGIFRKDKPAVCGEGMPASVIEQADKIGARLFREGREFASLPRKNMSLVLMVIQLLQEKLPVTQEAIDKGLTHATLPGRIQIIPGDIITILDVSHNRGSVSLLAEKLKTIPCQGKTFGVFSMLADKDMSACVEIIKDQIDIWCIAPLKTNRAASLEKLQAILRQQNIKDVITFSTIKAAYSYAKENAKTMDRIVVFGSFHTVAEGECNGCTKIKDHQ